MEGIWEGALGVAGVGAIGAFVFWSLYKHWLKLPIFQAMTKEQQYSLFKLFMVLTFLFSMSALLIYAFTKFQQPRVAERGIPSPQISFGQIEIADSVCAWDPLKKPYQITAPICGPDGNYWRTGGPPKGKPRQSCTMGTHQPWPLNGLNVVGPPQVIKSEDPVFDITIVNKSRDAAVTSRIGIRPIAAWTSPKGPPYAGKVQVSDGYSLTIRGFEPGEDQWLALPEPIYLSANAPYRFRLMLTGYCGQIHRNESVLRLIAEVDLNVIESPDIYLGLWSAGV